MEKIREDLMQILACPKCKTHVVQSENGIKCTSETCGLVYPVRNGIPVMLIEEAVEADVGHLTLDK